MESKIHRFFSMYVDLVKDHLFCAIALISVITAITVYGTSRLAIRGDLKELLPDNYESVEELNKALKRIGGVGNLVVTVESPNVSANKRFMDDLAVKLGDLPKGTIRYFDYKSDEIRDFYESHFPYYLSNSDLDELYDSVDRRIDYEKLRHTKLFMNFADEDPLSAEIEAIRERNQKNNQAPVQTYDNYYGGEWGRLLMMMIKPFGATLTTDKARDLINSIEGMVAELNPASYDPHMEIGFCGDVKSTVEEYDSLKRDILSTAILCVTLVSLAIIVFFLRVRVVFLVGSTLLIALSWTFAITYLIIGYLNSQTAFLGSIILGTGINYGIILMARYVEERKKQREHVEAMKLALRHTISPTFLAAITTAVSFSVLFVAKIKGLSQFGFIGAMGVSLCWLATVLILPVFTLATERIRNMVKVRDRPARKSAILAILTKWIATSPVKVLAVSLVIIIVSLIFIVQFVPRSIEYDFTKLRNKRSVSSGTEALERRVSKFFKGSMTPAIVLVDDASDAPKVCAAVEAKNMSLPEVDRRVGTCYSIFNLLPSDQSGKLPRLAKFKRLLDDNEQLVGRLSEDLRKKVEKIRATLTGHPMTVDDLPPALTKHFQDLEGNKGVVVFINPRPGMFLSDGRNLVRFADTIRDIKMPDGRILHAAGASLVFSDLVNAIRREAPILTLASFLGVLAFVALVIRNRHVSLVIVTSLLLGIISMVGCISLFRIKFNFFNFIALPLMFGICVDYSINVALRLARDKVDGIEHALRNTGAAVVLCSLTTIIGYLVLLAANNQALASFGVIAIMGEMTCILAAIIFTPAFMVFLKQRILRREIGKIEEDLEPVEAEFL